MTLKLTIDELAIDTLGGQRLNPTVLKAAIERELAGLIRDPSAITSAPTKTLVSRTAMTGAARGEAQVARDMAARIYEAMKR